MSAPAQTPGSVRSPARRAAVTVAAAAYLLLTLLLGMPSARADTGQGTLTDLAFDGTTLRGVLTVAGVQGGERVDPNTLAVTVGGKTLPATIVSSTSSRRAVFLVVDTSGSMGHNGGNDAAKAALGGFLQRVPADVLVGLVSFSNAARVDVDLTTDREPIQAAVSHLPASGNTALYDAVNLAVTRLGSSGTAASSCSPTAPTKAPRRPWTPPRPRWPPPASGSTSSRSRPAPPTSPARRPPWPPPVTAPSRPRRTRPRSTPRSVRPPGPWTAR